MEEQFTGTQTAVASPPEVQPIQNGHLEPVAVPAPPPTPTGPRMQRREVWLELPEPYAGFKFKAWMNYPNRLWLDFVKAAPPDATDDVLTEISNRQRAALGAMVIEHNGWLDFDGTPLPPASDVDEFWSAISTELAAAVIALLKARQADLGNSFAPRTRGR